MTKVDESSRRAARALGERLARVGQEEPRRASFTDVGTIESVLADGTALVSYRGGTIGPLPMTCDCVCAAKGRSCVIAIDGPIVRVIGIVARSSTDFEVPATTVTGTLPISHGGTGATTASSARSSLGLGSTPVTLVDGDFHNTSGTTQYFVIAHSRFPNTDGSCSRFIRAIGTIGDHGGTIKCAFDVTVNVRTPTRVFVSHLTTCPNAGISIRQTSDGVIWLYAWTNSVWYSATIAACAPNNSLDGKWQTSTPGGSLVWSGDNAAGHTISPWLYSGMAIGTGLRASGTTLSVDNGAYVRCPSARGLFTGSVVRTVSADIDSVVAFTDAQFKSLFGRSINIAGGDFVAFFNGDAGANDAHIEGASYVWSDKTVYAVLDKSRTFAASIRLNYLVVLV